MIYSAASMLQVIGVWTIGYSNVKGNTHSECQGDCGIKRLVAHNRIFPDHRINSLAANLLMYLYLCIN